ncbi:MAG: YbaK/EbsC family protein [Oscillospiraceae bacterium]|nr:YbaK/EbsC family protein [Oscillospiraceae bacterium]
MSIERVKHYFRELGMEDRILEFDVSSATVELAAQAAGVEPARIAKTLSFLLKDDRCVLVVTAGDAKVDNAKYKAFFGVKAKMLPHEAVPQYVGHAVGGVCPFVVNEGVAVYLDVSMKRFQTVFPAAGSANSAIELTLEELERFSGSKNWIDVCKDWQSAE